jgi:hypothetical protein
MGLFKKHVSHRKAKMFLKGVKKGEWYMVKDCKHLEMKLLMHARAGNLFFKKLLTGWWGKNIENLSSLPFYFTL